MVKENKLAETKKRVRDAFIVFEYREGSKLVDVKEVPTVVRSLGCNPSTTQLKSIQEQIAALTPDDSHYVSLEQFEAVVSRFLVENEDYLVRDDYHTLLRAFKALDPEGSGYIDAEVMRQAMMTKGEPFSKDEQDNLLNYAVDEDTGRIYYEEYAYKLANDGRRI